MIGQPWRHIAEQEESAGRHVQCQIGLVLVALDRSSSKVSIGGVTGSKRCVEEEDLKKTELLESPKRLVAPKRMLNKGGKCDSE